MNENVINSECPLRAASTPVWPDKDILPIAAYSPVPFKPGIKNENDLITPVSAVSSEEMHQIYASVKECGFNTVILQSNENEVSNQFPPDDVDIKVVINSGGLHKNASTCYDEIKKYINNKNVVAWNIADEPNPFMWGDAAYSYDNESGYNDDTKWNQLTVGFGMTSSIDLSRVTMFNLAVGTAKRIIGSFGASQAPLYAARTLYRSYLNNLQTLYQPRIWSYDYYPIRNELIKINGKNEVVSGKYFAEYETFFAYLGIFQDFTQSIGSEFWAFGLCLEHKLYKDYDWKYLNTYFPKATEGALRFEVFSALLFGAQGICYYRYGLGRTKEHVTIDYSNSNPSDVDGSDLPKFQSDQENIMAPLYFKKEGSDYRLVKSQIWFNVMTVNREIKKFQDIFLGCKVTGHGQFKGSEGSVIASLRWFTGNKQDIDRGIEVTSCEGTGLLLTSFTNNGPDGKTRHYVAMMNLDPFSTCKFAFDLKKGRIYSEYCHIAAMGASDDAKGLSSEIPSGYASNYKFTLKEGGMLAIYWDE